MGKQDMVGLCPWVETEAVESCANSSHLNGNPCCMLTVASRAQAESTQAELARLGSMITVDHDMEQEGKEIKLRSCLYLLEPYIVPS